MSAKSILVLKARGLKYVKMMPHSGDYCGMLPKRIEEVVLVRILDFEIRPTNERKLSK